MTLYIVRRFLNGLILTVIATILTYVLASSVLNPRARYDGMRPQPPEESITGALDRLGVNPDVPLLERTINWFTNLLTGDFGLTYAERSVANDLVERSMVSLQLLVVGSILGAILGVAVGVWGAVRQYRFSDQATTYASYVILATPTFVVGVILMILATELNRATGMQIISFTGSYSPGVEGFWPRVVDKISHLSLPTIALALMGAADYSRYQRNSMLDVLGADYIRTARSKGLRRNKAMVKHGVRVALIPMSTYFSYSFGTLLAGSTMLELVFSWRGMGQLALTSITNNDINSVAAVGFYTAVLLLISSTLAEILYAALDPRVRVT